MKRGLAFVVAAVLILGLCAGAQAEGKLAKYYEAAEKLLFETDNVTLEVKAELSLDGEWFKTAEVSLAQDRNRSGRQLHLYSPKADGTKRHNGWSIVTEGEKLYLIEYYNPTVYRTGLSHEHVSLVRGTVETEPLARLGALLSSSADLLMPEELMTEKDGKELTARIDGDSSYLADTVLNMLWHFGARRWFSMNYDGIETDSRISMAPFITVTQALLWCTRSLELQNADVVISLDDEGRFKEMNGTAAVRLETLSDGIRVLEVSFHAAATAYGTTMIKRFDPDDLGVVLAEDAVSYDD